MTGTPKGPRPSWTPDLLADLHAGVLPEREATALRTAVADDPGALAVLAALDGVVADLGGLSDDPPTMPEDVAARIDAALAAQPLPTHPPDIAVTRLPLTPPTPVVSLANRRRGRISWGVGAVLAAAAAVGAVFLVRPVVVPGPVPTTTDGPSAPLNLASGRLDTLPGGVIGGTEYGPLADPVVLAVCLRANGAPPTTKPMGARSVAVGEERTPGVLMALPGGRPAAVRLLIVGLDCGAGNPATLGDSVIGG